MWNPSSFHCAPLLSSTDRTEAPAPFHKSHPLCLQAFPTSILLNEDFYNAYRDTADRRFQLLTELFILAQTNPIRKVVLNSVQWCSGQAHKFALTSMSIVECIALSNTGWIHSVSWATPEENSKCRRWIASSWMKSCWLARISLKPSGIPCLLPI